MRLKYYGVISFRYNSVSKFHKPRIVPIGPTVPELDPGVQPPDNSARRLEVSQIFLRMLGIKKLRSPRVLF